MVGGEQGGGGVPNLIEKGYNVESARRSGKSLADGVDIPSSRTKEGAESIVGWRERGHAKVTSGSRWCSGPASEIAGLKVPVGDEVGGCEAGRRGEHRNC